MTMWIYYEVVAPDLVLPGAYADVLARLRPRPRSTRRVTQAKTLKRSSSAAKRLRPRHDLG
jgi:hypothetical protein